MSSAADSIRIVEIDVDSDDQVTRERLRASWRLTSEAYAEVSGPGLHGVTFEAFLAHLASREYTDKLRWVALEGELVVGCARLNLPRVENRTLGEIGIEVERAHRGRGIGSLLLAAVEKAARDAGRERLEAWADEPPATGETIRPKTGDGEAPADFSASRFGLARGYELSMVDILSSLDLSELELGVPDAAKDATGPDSLAGYDIVTWVDRTPDEYLDAMVTMLRRFSKDVPQSEEGWEEEQWDAARIRSAEKTSEGAGESVVTALALSGETPVAFTQQVGSDGQTAANQGALLVVAEHRGRGLGRAVKDAAHRKLRETLPQCTRILTWNAAGNKHVLAINRALGYRPIAIETLWSKKL